MTSLPEREGEAGNLVSGERVDAERKGILPKMGQHRPWSQPIGV